MASGQETRTRYFRINPPDRLSLGFSEIWQHRELLYFLVWRDVKLRYKQTLLGSGWVILQPLLNVAIFTLIFGFFIRVPSDGIPYPLFTFMAMVPWSFFSSGLTSASNSLLSNANLIKRVYFPRLIIPIASILSVMLDLALTMLVLFGMMLAYRVTPTLNLLWLPLFILLAMISSLGIGFWLSSLNVQFRDVRFVVPFLTQFWMYATPIVWPISVLPAEWRFLIGLNPMAGAVEGFRWALLGTAMPSLTLFALSVVTALILLISGIVFFRHMEDRFADII
jgi:lipopolysaccharide transport system permease protein